MDEYCVIGVMSGTSLDGLDIALCRFNRIDGKWKYNIETAETIAYDNDWKNTLSRASELQTGPFLILHNSYGEYPSGP